MLSGKYKKRLLVLLFLAMEATSIALDQFGKSKLVVLLAALILAALGFAITLYTCVKRRARLEAEKQLKVVEVVFSLIQLVASIVHFVHTVLNIKKYYNLSVFFPLAFALTATAFVFKNDGNDDCLPEELPKISENDGMKNNSTPGELLDDNVEILVDEGKQKINTLRKRKEDGNRKATPKWTHQVRVRPGTGMEGVLDDGFSWRKYGQKDILGAKYARGYYRCTHRHVQGCLATKQVQRSDDDPMIFEITYLGTHTCTQASETTNSSILTPRENPEPNNISLVDPLQQQQQLSNYQQQQQQQQPQEALHKLRESLGVVTQDLDIHHESLPHQFHFPSTSTPDHYHLQSQVFSPSAMSASSTMITNTGSGNFPSPANIMSPSTSRTSFFPPLSGSPSGVITSFQGSASTTTNNNQNFQSSDQSAELNEIISAAASAANSPTVGVDFPFGNPEFEENFTFD